MLLTPGLASTAIAAEGGYGKSAPVALDRAGRFMPWYPVFNLTGQPAISVPAGFGADGLPLSVQFAGRMGDEETLFSLAGQIEAARPWAADRPAIARAVPELRSRASFADRVPARRHARSSRTSPRPARPIAETPPNSATASMLLRPAVVP